MRASRDMCVCTVIALYLNHIRDFTGLLGMDVIVTVMSNMKHMKFGPPGDGICKERDPGANSLRFGENYRRRLDVGE